MAHCEKHEATCDNVADYRDHKNWIGGADRGKPAGLEEHQAYDCGGRNAVQGKESIENVFQYFADAADLRS